jgi:hypothetical protein
VREVGPGLGHAAHSEVLRHGIRPRPAICGRRTTSGGSAFRLSRSSRTARQHPLVRMRCAWPWTVSTARASPSSLTNLPASYANRLVRWCGPRSMTFTTPAWSGTGVAAAHRVGSGWTPSTTTGCDTTCSTHSAPLVRVGTAPPFTTSIPTSTSTCRGLLGRLASCLCSMGCSCTATSCTTCGSCRFPRCALRCHRRPDGRPRRQQPRPSPSEHAPLRRRATHLLQELPAGQTRRPRDRQLRLGPPSPPGRPIADRPTDSGLGSDASGHGSQ